MDTTRDSAWLNEHLLHQLRSECVGFNQMKERKIPGGGNGIGTGWRRLCGCSGGGKKRRVR